jgi:hypothetical protein
MNDFAKKYKSSQRVGFFHSGNIILIILIAVSCTTMKNGKTEQKKELFTGKLSVLDNKLENFAKKYNTIVRSPKGSYYTSTGDNSVNPDSLEYREVSWVDGAIAKAILIQPHVDTAGIKLNTWDVCNLAWIIHAPTFEKPFCTYYLLKNADISILERNIDQLLSQSDENLRHVKVEDLK